jgi:hypothetical protein
VSHAMTDVSVPGDTSCHDADNEDYYSLVREIFTSVV